MCGITGYFNTVFGGGDESSHTAVLKSMTDALRHRGPDDAGTYLSLPNGLGLGHRRLSILDLSEAGRQPMTSASGRYVMIFNGEIYNHLEIRASLPTESWRGHSDTETLLAMIEHEGATLEILSRVVNQWVGMFALAVWDTQEKTLTLIRDRLGIKPLYYARMEQSLIFGSELKSMLQHPEMKASINPSGISSYLAYSCCSPSQCIYENTYQVWPGSMLQFRMDDGFLSSRKHVYWDLQNLYQADLVSQPWEDHIEAVHQQLKQAVAQRMLSDVKLGSFLSGGLDSSLVTALMQSESAEPIQSFTLSLEASLYNEAPHAAAIAKHLGTEHHELHLSADQALDLIPQIPELWDEPFADSSQIPTYLLSRLTRDHVTVALSGDGGDEVFGGYNRYLLAPQMWERASCYPYPVRRVMIAMMRRNPRWVYQVLFALNPRLNPEKAYGRSLESVIEKMAQVWLARDGKELHKRLCSIWSPEDQRVMMPDMPSASMDERAVAFRDELSNDLISMMMRGDTHFYLPNDILTKVDRASMAVGLETRVPLLDHRVMALMAAAPADWKVKDGRGKRVLREILNQYIPAEMLERPKSGFAIPLAEWLRGPLKAWAEEVWRDRGCRVATGLKYGLVDRVWAEHQSGQDHSAKIWNILMLHAWLKKHGQAH